MEEEENERKRRRIKKSGGSGKRRKHKMEENKEQDSEDIKEDPSLQNFFLSARAALIGSYFFIDNIPYRLGFVRSEINCSSVCTKG